MITASSPSYHNVFCPTAGTYSSYYFDALRANSRKSNKRVSLVKNTISRAQQPYQQEQQPKSVIEKKKSLLVNKTNNNNHNTNKNNTHCKKKSVRFSDNSDQVRLFYQWQTPQHQVVDDNKNNDIIIKNDNVPHQQQQHQVTSTATMTVTSSHNNKIPTKVPNQCVYQLDLVNYQLHEEEEEEKDTIAKREHLYQPLELKSVHIVQPQQLTSSPTILGTCHVANFAFEKHVMVRYTFDDWSTFTDLDAMYCESLGDSTMDRFTFEFQWKNNDHDASFLLQFALRYSVNGMEFWDNNHGENFCTRLVQQQIEEEKTTPKSTEAPWASSLSTLASNNISSATSINPWTTSPFWTHRFPIHNKHHNTITHYSSQQQQQQQLEPIHPPQHLTFSSSNNTIQHPSLVDNNPTNDISSHSFTPSSNNLTPTIAFIS